MISFILPMDPVAKGRPRVTKGGWTYTPEETKEAEALVRFYAEKVHELKGLKLKAVRLHLEFFVKRPQKPKWHLPVVRPDVDNYAKLVMDALNGYAWADDSQVTTLICRKVYALAEPHIKVSIEEDDICMKFTE
jgi:Holliday junction resolvase RusA-like endonuclease